MALKPDNLKVKPYDDDKDKDFLTPSSQGEVCEVPPAHLDNRQITHQLERIWNAQRAQILDSLTQTSLVSNDRWRGLVEEAKRRNLNLPIKMWRAE